MEHNKYPEERDFLEENLPSGEELLAEADLLLSDEPPVTEETELDPTIMFDPAVFEEAYAEKLATQEEAAEEGSDVLIDESIFAGEEFRPEDYAEFTDDRFHNPHTEAELTADDHAMYAAGLTHPNGQMDVPGPVYSDAPEDHPAYEEMNEETELTEEETDAIPHRERPARKGRPKRKKGYGLLGLPHLAATAVWLLIVVAIGVSLGRMVWVCAADVLAFGREPKEVVISITRDDTMDSIIEKLSDAGLVRYPQLFKLYADLTEAEEEISTGTYTLSTVYDYHALVNAMNPNTGSRAVVEDVLIPEGYNCRQIFALLEEKGICHAEDLEAWAIDGELEEYWFLENVERGHKYCLEGYLFPDTYDFYENSTPRQVLEKLLNGFENRFTEEMQAQIATLNETLATMMRDNGETEEYINDHLFTLKEVVTVASLIEKETAGPDESPQIAAVIYNRLFSWGDTPRYLNIDASIIYALDGKTNLTADDLAVDNPYNTYTYQGLTPGPISNPGVASLKAALEPASHDYYYYVLDPSEGVHIFSKTYEEHEANIARVREQSNG